MKLNLCGTRSGSRVAKELVRGSRAEYRYNLLLHLRDCLWLQSAVVVGGCNESMWTGNLTLDFF